MRNIGQDLFSLGRNEAGMSYDAETRKRCGRRGRELNLSRTRKKDLSYLKPKESDSQEVRELKNENYVLHHRNQVLRSVLQDYMKEKGIRA